MAMDFRRILYLGFIFVIGLFLASSAIAAVMNLPDGAKLDTSKECPICHMNADHGAPGPAAVVFKDGKVVGFDGAGDMFRYVLNPAKYEFDAANIKDVYVTDYTSKQFLDAKAAVYVLDSDVSASMGPEVVPFSKKEDAEKFKSEHKGEKIVAYSAITPEALKSKKKMLKMKPDEGHGGMSGMSMPKH